MEKDTLSEFMNHVFTNENLNDWYVCYCSCGAYCWREQKKICFPEEHKGLDIWETRLLFLHEIAHIDTESSGDQHNKLFYGKYARLILKYLA
jgi:hypothetical protein